MSARGGKLGLWSTMVIVVLLGGVGAAEQLRMPPDFTFQGAPGSPGPVVYSHEIHQAFADKCTACHIRLFPILSPTRHVSHSAMEAGKLCGACHNGQMAFGPTDPASCEKCHSTTARKSS